MSITGQITLDQVSIYQVDADPAVSGFAATVGSIATLYDGSNSGIWLKTGTGNTAWTAIAVGSLLPPFTQGSVPFANASGVLSQNNARFFWDNTNNRLGIGTNSPSYKLDISGNTSDTQVRIANTNSSLVSFFEVRNDTTNFIETGIYGSAVGGSLFGNANNGMAFIFTSATSGLSIGNSGASPIIFAVNNAEIARFDSNGRLGIGTKTPTAQLQVSNAANTTFMQVSSGWSGGTGTWINLDTTGPSGLGTGGPGNNPWIAYAAASGQWFTDALAGDVAYRNQTGRLLFGTTSGTSVMRMTGNDLTVGPTGTILTNNPFSVNGDVNSFLQSNVQNINAGTLASSDVVATANNGTDTNNYIDMGINSSTYSDPAFTINGPNDGYLYINGGDLSIGTATAHKIAFFTGDTLAANERARITSTGQFAIGSTSPSVSAKLQVDSTTQGFLMPRVTTAQMDAIATPAQGLQVYNTDLKTICTFDGSVWVFQIAQVVQNNQGTSSSTYGNITELVTPTLPTGRYVIEFAGAYQSTSTLVGVGIRLDGATISAINAKWNISQAANGTDSDYQYSQLAVGTNVTSASVLTANADFPVTGFGVFSLSAPGTVAAQLRTETNGTTVSVRINSALIIRRITG